MSVEMSLLEARPRVFPSQTPSVSTTLGTAFVTLTRDPEGQPLEVFLNVGKAGSETYAAAEALGRLISLALRLNSPVSRSERVLELAGQLEHIGAMANGSGWPPYRMHWREFCGKPRLSPHPPCRISHQRPKQFTLNQ